MRNLFPEPRLKFIWLGCGIGAVIGTMLGLILFIVWNEKPAIRARQPNAQMLYFILVCAYIAVLSIDWYYYDDRILMSTTVSSTFSILLFLSSIIRIGADHVYFFRLWKLYYKSCLQLAFSARTKTSQDYAEWIAKQHSCRHGDEYQKLQSYSQSYSEASSARSSFYVRHRNTLGNSKFVVPVLVSTWALFSAALVIFGAMGNGDNAVFWTTDTVIKVATIIPSCFVAVLFCYKTRIKDIFHIFNELAIALSLLNMSGMLYLFFNMSENAGAIGCRWAYMNSAIAYLLIIYVMDYTIHIASVHSWIDVNRIARGKRKEAKTVLKDECTLFEILEHKPAFHAFETHLRREFAVENLNFIVEVVQFRRILEKRQKRSALALNERKSRPQIFKSHTPSLQNSIHLVPSESVVPDGPWSSPEKQKSNSHESLSSDSHCELVVMGESIYWANIPTPSNKSPEKVFVEKRPPASKNGDKKSEKVNLHWMRPVMGDTQQIAVFIFEEFCRPDAFQEINLEKKIKQQLIDAFSGDGALDENKMRTLFDDAFEQILNMLKHDSLRRFKTTKAFLDVQTSIRTVWITHTILHAENGRDKTIVLSDVVDTSKGSKRDWKRTR